MKNITSRLRTVAVNCKKLTLLASLPLVSMQVIADEDHEFERAQHVSKETAIYQDSQLLAKERGISTREVAASLAFQNEFEAFFKETLKAYPNQIARVWVEKVPHQEAHIQFVGDMPNVKTNLNIHVSDGGLFSFQEQEQRAAALTELLKSNDESNFLTYFDHQSGQIKLEMKSINRAQAMSSEALDQMLIRATSQLDTDEKSLLKGLTIEDIDYEVVEGSGEIYDFDWARGGEWLNRNNSNMCTSGWAVSGPNGNGIVTAAHCTGLDELDHHYTTSDPTMTFRSQERGNGDVEYHTTSHTEVAEYYAREDEVRDVTGIKLTWLMFAGQSVCEYGRSDNVRSCNHDVISNNVTATFTDGVTVSNLVRVTGDDSIGGDSGGPWSWGTVAWGVHSGSNGSTSLFTPVQRAQSELNITILTQ